MLVMIVPLQEGTSVPFRLATKELRAPGGNGPAQKPANGKKGEAEKLEGTPGVEIDFPGIADRIGSIRRAVGLQSVTIADARERVPPILGVSALL